MRALTAAMATVGVLLCWNAGAASGPIESLDDIRDGARQYLLELSDEPDAIEVEVRAMDSRLRLSRCSEPLEYFLPPGARRVGNVSVGVRCTGDRPWKLYTSAIVRLFRDVVVAAAPLDRNTILDASDLTVESRDVSTLSGNYLSRVEELTGRILRRSLAAGQPVTGSTVRERRLVRRGEQVTLTARTPGFVVRSEGKALRDGAEGDVIPVRNMKSKRTVEGVVTGPGMVQVRM